MLDSYWNACVWLFVAGWTFYVAQGELTITGPRCGVLSCKPQEYCSSFDNQCKSCEDICNKDSHNFEEKLCVDRCQDYLHDIRYVRIGAGNANSKAGFSSGGSNDDDINKLYKLAASALIIAILLVICNVAYCAFKLHKWAKKNDVNANNIVSYFKKDNSNDDPEKANGVSNASTATPKRDLRLNISGSIAHSDNLTTPATMTTSISRRPAEDSALDYAYDNHAMTGTPSPHSGKAPHESNF